MSVSRRSHALGAAMGTLLVAASVTWAPGALAAPGGQGNGQGQAAGAHKGPHSGVAAGNPHRSGSTGNPHSGSSSGNPHSGSAPYGVATGYGASSAAGGNSDSTGGGSANSNAGGQGKTTICHATGSAKNPYVVITPANPGVQNGHAGHQDGRDIIPAPAGATKGPHGGGACAQSSTTGTSPNTPPGQGAQAVLGTTQGGQPGNQVAGNLTQGNPSGPAAASATEAAKGELPFTGMAAMALGTIGVILLFGGWLVRALGLGEGPQKR
jgi:hypothetical protein